MEFSLTEEQFDFSWQRVGLYVILRVGSWAWFLSTTCERRCIYRAHELYGYSILTTTRHRGGMGNDLPIIGVVAWGKNDSIRL